ncbi:MAG: 50S ribosomal protein L22 [Bacilli bacterium]|nr:50S ribosomal protein L22 [Bacilli bacterium]MDD4282515.1 50S ribosomal protein L22 [Bacilli bacterium]MDD4718276.1 50S ribosomal protein L22 [Bacilli bacterium]
MEAKAIAKSVRIAPRKARLVIDLIRDKSVTEADVILKNLNKEAARLIYKVLVSAVANAENNLELNKENLYVKKAFIDEGQTMKRIKFGSRGHVDPIKKRTSHITIVVSDEK